MAQFVRDEGVRGDSAGERPFIEVVTRAFLRPRMLGENQESLRLQTDGDWVQTLLRDRVGFGIGASHLALRKNAKRLIGVYIWLLDDDDMVIRPTFFAEIRQIAAAHDPDVIMVRMDHGRRGILPDDGHWEQRPVIGHVGCSAYVIRRRVWQDNAHIWNERYCADGDFIQAVFDSGATVYWHDVIASRTQRISLGAPE